MTERNLSAALRRLRARTQDGGAARTPEEQLRRRQALEINDNVVQGLTVAKYALDAGNYDDARRAIERTLTAARHIITELLDDGPDDLRLVAGDLIRLEPASVVQSSPRE